MLIMLSSEFCFYFFIILYMHCTLKNPCKMICHVTFLSFYFSQHKRNIKLVLLLIHYNIFNIMVMNLVGGLLVNFWASNRLCNSYCSPAVHSVVSHMTLVTASRFQSGCLLYQRCEWPFQFLLTWNTKKSLKL